MYVADILASQFASALDEDARRDVYESFKVVLWAHTEGRMRVSQQYMRYYAEIMEVCFTGFWLLYSVGGPM